MSFLEVNQISKFEGERAVVKDITLALMREQKLALMGETGSGKSSLMKIISGYLKADRGHVLFNSEKILPPDEVLIPGHKGIAYLSQHFELRNNYRVIELLEMASQLNDQEAGKIFEVCQIQHLVQRRTDQLSGGEKQRIALARLLITKPQLLILDEPFTNLDRSHKNIITEVIRQLSDLLHITCILVSHDPIDVLSWANKMIILKSGAIVQQGVPKEVYYSPKNEYTAGIMGDYSMLNENHIYILHQWGINNTLFPLFIRPEQLSIVDQATNTIEAVVKKSLFYGGYSMVHAAIDDLTLIIQTQKDSLKTGEKVFVKYNAQV
jgi:ABC-type sulfate/molybdate transport systems ATPase subunit